MHWKEKDAIRIIWSASVGPPPGPPNPPLALPWPLCRISHIISSRVSTLWLRLWNWFMISVLIAIWSMYRDLIATITFAWPWGSEEPRDLGYVDNPAISLKPPPSHPCASSPAACRSPLSMTSTTRGSTWIFLTVNVLTILVWLVGCLYCPSKGTL